MRAAIPGLLSLALICSSAAAQQPRAAQWLEELDRDVWVPFMEGVRKDDEKLYLGVRSRDYVRVQAGAKLILTYDDYVDDTVKMMANYREQGTRISVEVRFEERIVDGRSASEKGISRVLFQTRDGEPRTYYSRFQTISRKEDGRWRVLTDYFPDTDPARSEQAFLAAKPIGEFDGFLCYMAYPNKKQRCD